MLKKSFHGMMEDMQSQPTFGADNTIGPGTDWLQTTANSVRG